MPNGDLHKEIGNLKLMIGRLEGKVDHFIKSVDETNDNHQNLETRVRKVEGGQKLHTGVAIGISSFASYLINHIIRL